MLLVLRPYFWVMKENRCRTRIAKELTAHPEGVKLRLKMSLGEVPLASNSRLPGAQPQWTFALLALLKLIRKFAHHSAWSGPSEEKIDWESLSNTFSHLGKNIHFSKCYTYTISIEFYGRGMIFPCTDHKTETHTHTEGLSEVSKATGHWWKWYCNSIFITSIPKATPYPSVLSAWLL